MHFSYGITFSPTVLHHKNRSVGLVIHSNLYITISKKILFQKLISYDAPFGRLLLHLTQDLYYRLLLLKFLYCTARRLYFGVPMTSSGVLYFNYQHISPMTRWSSVSFLSTQPYEEGAKNGAMFSCPPMTASSRHRPRPWGGGKEFRIATMKEIKTALLRCSL